MRTITAMKTILPCIVRFRQMMPGATWRGVNTHLVAAFKTVGLSEGGKGVTAVKLTPGS